MAIKKIRTVHPSRIHEYYGKKIAGAKTQTELTRAQQGLRRATGQQPLPPTPKIAKAIEREARARGGIVDKSAEYRNAAGEATPRRVGNVQATKTVAGRAAGSRGGDQIAAQVASGRASRAQRAAMADAKFKVVRDYIAQARAGDPDADPDVEASRLIDRRPRDAEHIAKQMAENKAAETRDPALTGTPAGDAASKIATKMDAANAQSAAKAAAVGNPAVKNEAALSQSRSFAKMADEAEDEGDLAASVGDDRKANIKLAKAERDRITARQMAAEAFGDAEASEVARIDRDIHDAERAMAIEKRSMGRSSAPADVGRSMTEIRKMEHKIAELKRRRQAAIDKAGKGRPADYGDQPRNELGQFWFK